MPSAAAPIAIRSRPGSRRDTLLDEAARLFRAHGYHGTSVREIARAIDATPGALYSHYPSKAHLLVAVYREGVRRIVDAVESSVAAGEGDPSPGALPSRGAVTSPGALPSRGAVTSPGALPSRGAVTSPGAAPSPAERPAARLVAACTAHLEALLEGGDYASVVVRVLPADVEGAEAELLQIRDSYESRFKQLIALLVKPAERTIFRLALLGTLNAVPTWYRKTGKLRPKAIARNIVHLLLGSRQP